MGPFSHWLVDENRGASSETPEKQQVNDDRWYTKLPNRTQRISTKRTLLVWGYLSPSANLKFADVPSGIAAISKVPLEGWLQVRHSVAHK